MGVFGDIFGGDAQKEAAEKTRNYLEANKRESFGLLDNAESRGIQHINTGVTTGRDALSTGYSTSRGDINSGANAGIDYLTAGSNEALRRLDAARNGTSGTYASLAGLGDKYGGATTLALNALGVTGTGGVDAARSAFETSPGYNFNLDQGLEAINRRRAAGGMLASGNADRDAQIYGAGLASQEYDKWLNNLLGFTSPELAATSGAASGNAALDLAGATAANTAGQNRAAVETARGSMLADLARTYGQNVASLDTTQGYNLANLVGNTARAKAGVMTSQQAPYAGTYKQEADAQTAGSANLFNLGMKVAGAAISGLSGGLGSFGGAPMSLNPGNFGGTGLPGYGGLY